MKIELVLVVVLAAISVGIASSNDITPSTKDITPDDIIAGGNVTRIEHPILMQQHLLYHIPIQRMLAMLEM